MMIDVITPKRQQEECTPRMNAISISGDLLKVQNRSLGAAGIYKNVRVDLTQISVPRPKADEVLVKILAVSVCGSDYHMLTPSDNGSPICSCPAQGLEQEGGLVLGHECSGEIVELGSEVHGFQIGDMVTAESVLPCRKNDCRPCCDKSFNYCKSSRLVGFQTDGVFAEFAVLPATALHSLNGLKDQCGSDAAIISGSQIEPIGVALNAISAGLAGWSKERRAALRILGAGPVGLYVAVLANMMELETVIEEPISRRRQLAALYVTALEPAQGDNGCIPADIILDCYGCPDPESLLSRIREGGSIVYLARTGQKLNLSVDSLMNHGAHLSGIRGHIGYMEKAIALITTGKLNPRTAITRELEGIDTLYQWLCKPQNFLNEGKVICRIS